jgi:hypothetical protein
MAGKNSGFEPVFKITPAIARGLMRIEAMKHAIEALPITPRVLANLRHNYHLSRAEADITGWIAYFIEGMATSFEKVHAQAKAEAQTGAVDRSQL